MLQLVRDVRGLRVFRGAEERIGRLPRPPLPLAAALLAAAAFGLALFVGWATAGPREPLGRARLVTGANAPARVAGLSQVRALPAAPKARVGAAPAPARRLPPAAPRDQRGKLIVGTG